MRAWLPLRGPLDLYLAIAGIIILISASAYINFASTSTSKIVVDTSFSLQPGSGIQFQFRVPSEAQGELLLRIIGPLDKEAYVSLRSANGTKIFEDTVSGTYTVQIPLHSGGSPFKLLVYYYAGSGAYEGAIAAIASYEEPIYQSNAACTPLLLAAVGALLAGTGIGSRLSSRIGIVESGNPPAA